MTDIEEIVARARGCLGVRFRPHGRDPRFGLDCVGVAAIAFARVALAAYPIRSADIATADAAIVTAGFRRADGAGPGALALVSAAATQLHLVVLTDRGFVHADARLKRVVETPGRPDRIVSTWRAEV